MFLKLGRVVVGHPWRVIGLWLIATFVVVGFAPKLATTTDESSFLPSHYQAIQAQKLQKKDFRGTTAPAAIIVVARAGGHTLSAGDLAEVATLSRELAARRIPALATISLGPVAPNRLVATIAVQLPHVTGHLTKMQASGVKTLRADLVSLTSGSDLRAGVTGSAAQAYDQQQSGNKADKVILVGTIALILGLLLLIFRSPIVAVLPVITIGVVA